MHRQLILSTGKCLFLLAQLTFFYPAGATANDSTSISRDELQFLVIGDWGRYASKNQLRVARQMDKLAATVTIDFIVTTGDNFYPKGVLGVDDAHWKESFKNVYTLPHLDGIPWFPTLGNHDYMGNIYAQVEFSAIDGQWQLPAPYYKKQFLLGDGNSVQLFFLDTNPLLEQYTDRPGLYLHIDSQEPRRQLSWLYRGLRKSASRWRIALGHHPVFSAGYHGDSDELGSQLLRLFKQHKVQAYFAGHDHHLEHYSDGGFTQFYISGAGSRVRKVSPGKNTKFSASTPGFAHVRIRSSCMWTSFINAQGEKLYQSSQSVDGGITCNSE